MSFSYRVVSGFAEFMRHLPRLDPHEHVLVVNGENTTFEKFRMHLRDAKGCVSDFDGTLHPGVQWEDLRRCMTSDHEADDRAHATRYFTRGIKDVHDEIDFAFSSVRRLQESNLSRDQLSICASRAEPREGACDLLRSFGGRAQIVSFGIHDYIQSWLDYRRLTASVAALSLRWDEFGVIAGFDARSVVTDGNKAYMYDAFLAEHRLRPAQVLGIGDAPTDIGMMRPDGLSVLVIPKIDPQPERVEYRLRGLADLWQRVSAVLVSDSLEPLVEIRSS